MLKVGYGKDICDSLIILFANTLSWKGCDLG
jgi:hypothetical protein